MIRTSFGGLLAALALASHSPAAAVSQTSDSAPPPAPSHCQAIDYSEPPAGSVALVIDQLEGQTAFAVTGGPLELSGPAGICALLFRPGNENPVTVGATGEGGRFAFPRPEPGSYILVAASEPIRDLAVPLRISDVPPHPDAERGLLLHLRAAEDERGSFASVIRHIGLRRELLEMKRLDQEVRNELLREGFGTPDPELVSRLAAVDGRNLVRLQALVEEHGWPGSDLVGTEGAQGAFLVLQHAPHAVQKELFPLVEDGYRAGTVSGESYALLLDRIRVGDGRPQVYGSQATWTDGELTFEPIEDEANVDARRAEIGLPPLAEYRELLERMYLPAR